MKSKDEILSVHKFLADLAQGKLPIGVSEEAQEIIAAQCAVLRWVLEWPEDQSFQMAIDQTVKCLTKTGWRDERLRPKKHKIISLVE